MTLENVGATLASICSPIEMTSFLLISSSESVDPFPAEDDASLLAAAEMVDIGGQVIHYLCGWGGPELSAYP